MTAHDRTRVASPTRRGFLATIIGVGAAVGLRKSTDAFAAVSSTNKALVWRLDSHWGFPTGPKNKTHCKCRACIGHATNKVFATKTDAEAGRIHAHCVCQPRAVQVDATKYDQFFNGANSVDLRHTGMAAAYSAMLVASH